MAESRGRNPPTLEILHSDVADLGYKLLSLEPVLPLVSGHHLRRVLLLLLLMMMMMMTVHGSLRPLQQPPPHCLLF